MNYRRIGTPSGTLFLSHRFDDVLLEAGVRDFYSFLGKYTVRVQERNLTTFIVLRGALKNGPEQILVKRYPHGSIEQQVKDLFRWSRGVREFKAQAAAVEAGIAAPVPVAAFESKRTVAKLESFILVEDVQNARNVMELAQDRTGPLADARERFKFTRQMGRFISDCHQKGMYHGDLNATNIIAERLENGNWRFLVIDFLNVKILKALSPARRIKELARLEKSVGIHVNHADSLRFYMAYSEGIERLLGDRAKIFEDIRKRIIATEEPKIRESRRGKRTEAIMLRYGKTRGKSETK